MTHAIEILLMVMIIIHINPNLTVSRGLVANRPEASYANETAQRIPTYRLEQSAGSNDYNSAVFDRSSGPT